MLLIIWIYGYIWLHADRDQDFPNDVTAVKVVDDGTALSDFSSVVWTLGAGDSDTSTMDNNSSVAGTISTPWDDTSHIRYSTSDINAINETSDFVWVGISLHISSNAAAATPTGTIYIHFKATTQT